MKGSSEMLGAKIKTSPLLSHPPEQCFDQDADAHVEYSLETSGH